MFFYKRIYLLLFAYSLIWAIWVLSKIFALSFHFLKINNILIFKKSIYLSSVFSISFFFIIVTIVLINRKTIEFIKNSYLEINKFFWPNFQKVLKLTFNVLCLLFIIILILGILDVFFLNLTNFFYKDISL